jgi:hypothetical protein
MSLFDEDVAEGLKCSGCNCTIDGRAPGYSRSCVGCSTDGFEESESSDKEQSPRVKVLCPNEECALNFAEWFLDFGQEQYWEYINEIQKGAEVQLGMFNFQYDITPDATGAIVIKGV